MTTALYAGSFDPLTNGHEYIIRQGSKLFEKLIVAVGVNPDKKSAFSPSDRIAMTKAVCAKYSNVEVVELGVEYTVQAAKDRGVQVLIRGLRNATDFEYEQTIRHINEKIDPNVSTVYLTPPKPLEDVSSSLVRGLVGPKGWRRFVDRFVDEEVFKYVCKAYAKKQWDRFISSTPYFRDSFNSFEKLCVGEYPADSDGYMKPERYYHTFDHILACLEELSAFRVHHDANPPDGGTKGYSPGYLNHEEFGYIEAAIWFHDWYYRTDPEAKKGISEEVSARKCAEYGITGERASYMVEATATHVPEMQSKQGSWLAMPPRVDVLKVFLDIDLSILGQPHDEYVRYAFNVRKEYQHVPDDLFRHARREILMGLQKRPTLYLTSYFQSRYEKQARENISLEISCLKSDFIWNFP
jgi:pantetheine-phosphate adenylyltransferase